MLLLAHLNQPPYKLLLLITVAVDSIPVKQITYYSIKHFWCKDLVVF